MAEGFLGGLLGGDDAAAEGAEALEAAGKDARSDGLALSVATDLARGDPEVARHTAAFMQAQAAIARLEAAQAPQELHLRLHHLRTQAREGRLRRAGQRVRLAMQVFAAMAVGTIAFAFVSMFYGAVTSHSIVVDAFRAPAALAGQGLTGDVVASGILDTLQKLQDATRAETKGLETHGAWASDIKVEVPETGVSVGEIDRLLHDRFSHDVHIDGDLIQNAGGLALTVRGDGVPASTFTGTDIGTLTRRAAEYVYGRSQPVRYAQYLLGNYRAADALAFLPGAFGRAGTDTERATLATRWGNAYLNAGHPEQAAGKLRLAISLAPRWSRSFWTASADLIIAEALSHGEEAAWTPARAMLDAVAAAPAPDRPAVRALGNPAQVVWDLPLLLAGDLQDISLFGIAGTFSNSVGPVTADVYSLLHDPAQSARYIAASDPADILTKAETWLLQGYAALDRGDAAGAVQPLAAFDKAWLASPDVRYGFADQPCFLGLAYGLGGRLAEADAVFTRIGPWSRCYAFRGDMLAHAGDVASAERAWADGIRILPDLPMIYLHRGLFELGHDELGAAEADFSTAAAKAPHFADPLKAWGDLLAREGRWPDAIAKYDRALRYAPAWAELHEARDAAERKLTQAADTRPP